MAKRKLFDELMEGIAAMKSHREGKLKVRSLKVEVLPKSKRDKSPSKKHGNIA